MSVKKRFAVGVICGGVVWVVGMGAAWAGQQRGGVPTLDEILGQLQANLNAYDRDVPSFFCDEHVVSSVEPSVGNQETVTDSVFRLKRVDRADHTEALEESREIKSVNGKRPTSEDMQGPSLLSGAFEGGLAVVSLDQAGCMRYSVERSRPGEDYVVRFATVRSPESPDRCLLQERSSGRVVIDPASMEIKRLELKTPHHTIIPGTWYAARVVGERLVTVDYAPVELDGKTFWMPATIGMRSTSGGGTFERTVWSFRATYRDYHKLEVKSRILPGVTVAR